MNLNMSFKHMDASEAVKAYATEKCETLKKYFDGRVNVTWTFSVEKQGHVAHCHLLGKNVDYFGQSESENMYAAIDFTIDKIERQVQKHKEIVKDHLHRNGHRTPSTPSGGTSAAS